MPLRLRGAIGAVTYAVASVWLSVTVCFGLVRGLPGDAAAAEIALVGASEQAFAERRESLGLDRPLHAQYIAYWAGVLRGDLGNSWVSGEPVAQILASRGGQTAAIALGGLALGIALGFGFGVVGGLGHGWGRHAARGLTDLLIAMPVYVIGTIVIVLGVLTGYGGIVLTLGLQTGGVLANTVIGALDQGYAHGYVRTAIGKGLPPHLVLWRHRVRPILRDVLPIVSVQAGFLLGGTVITEGLFSQAGLGQALLDAVLRRDYPVLQGGVLYLAGVQAVIVSMTRILTVQLDPTQRDAGEDSSWRVSA